MIKSLYAKKVFFLFRFNNFNYFGFCFYCIYFWLFWVPFLYPALYCSSFRHYANHRSPHSAKYLPGYGRKNKRSLLLAKMLKENKVEPYLINHLFQSFDDAILVLNRDGIVIKAWPESREALIGENLSHREYFQKTRESLKPYLGGHIKSILDTNIVSCSIPVIENGEFQGAIARGMTLEQGKSGNLYLPLKSLRPEESPSWTRIITFYSLPIPKTSGKLSLLFL